ncbi:MAG TPA: DNA translocase FtsK 4TM domain-containing protein, partial [Pelomicrobium sp.]|nr:DNA translocase FtsK 4TM domain-containing protein [Pelomicrobium sp.]
MALRKAMAQKVAPSPLPPRVAALIRESWWLAMVALAVFVALVLVTYEPADPAWSRSGTGEVVRNAGGHVGAWVSDILLYLFGLSAYWWVVFFLLAVWWGYKRIETVSFLDRRSFLVGGTGFVVLLLSSSSLEALRLYTLKAALPAGPGGVVGQAVGHGVATALGFTGATMVLLILIAAGLSLFTGLSWIRVVEGLGAAVETGYRWTTETFAAWRDRREGREATAKREEVLEVERRRREDFEPLRIEPPVVEIPKSVRVEKEKQVPLFESLPDSLVPPLHLLDPAPEERETVAAETLEYTSRLIERRLAEFGVEVKVVAAYPGPVITRYEIEPAMGVKGSQIVGLVRDLARALSVVSIRVVEVIPGKTTMGLEIPNPHRQVVKLSEILSSKTYADAASPLALALGKDIAGNPVTVDLGKMPHLLVAGTTGSGKSVAINAMILSVVYKAPPSQV